MRRWSGPFSSHFLLALNLSTQIANQVEESKATIENLQRSLQEAKQKQKLAQEEVKKLERDMEEFKNNKEGKIDELKVVQLRKECAALTFCHREISANRRLRSRSIQSS